MLHDGSAGSLQHGAQDIPLQTLCIQDEQEEGQPGSGEGRDDLHMHRRSSLE